LENKKMIMLATQLINKAYPIGMTQEKQEITDLTQFVINLKPKNIMEIGSKLGGTFDLWCNISTNKKISVDLPGGIHGGWITKGHPYMGDIYKKRNQYFKKNYNKVNMITGDSHSKKTKDLVKKFLDGEFLDFLFIDGDHTYEGVKQDFEEYKEFVKSGGWVAFHDINDTKHHREMDVYVGKLWNELKGNKKEFNLKKHWAGIGVIQV